MTTIIIGYQVGIIIMNLYKKKQGEFKNTTFEIGRCFLFDNFNREVYPKFLYEE